MSIDHPMPPGADAMTADHRRLPRRDGNAPERTP